jgi:plasmid replication initiation protein
MKQLHYTQIFKTNKAIQISNNLTVCERRFFNQIIAIVKAAPKENHAKKEYKANIASFLNLLNHKSNTRYSEVRSVLDKLLQKIVTMITPTEEEWCNTNYIAEHELTKETKTITFGISKNIQNLILDISKGYTDLDAGILNRLKSKHSMALYENLMSITFKTNTVCINLDKLKRQLCGDEYAYINYFWYFQANVLKPAIAEINAKTNIHVEYEAIKNIFNKVEKIQFKVIKHGRLEGQEAPTEEKQASMMETIAALPYKAVTSFKEALKYKSKLEIKPEIEKSREIEEENQPKAVKELLNIGILKSKATAMHAKEPERLQAIVHEVAIRYRYKKAEEQARIIVKLFDQNACEIKQRQSLKIENQTQNTYTNIENQTQNMHTNVVNQQQNTHTQEIFKLQTTEQIQAKPQNHLNFDQLSEEEKITLMKKNVHKIHPRQLQEMQNDYEIKLFERNRDFYNPNHNDYIEDFFKTSSGINFIRHFDERNNKIKKDAPQYVRNAFTSYIRECIKAIIVEKYFKIDDFYSWLTGHNVVRTYLI